MINTKKIKSIVGVMAVMALVMGFALSAKAEMGGVGVTVNANTNGGGNVDVNATATVTLSKVISRSDAAITARIEALNKLSARIGEMKNVSATEKARIAAEVEAQIGSLNTLKAKIDADTDVETARKDALTITGDYRIYALIIPQGSILAASDRVTTIVGLMNALQVKLQARISAAATAGNDVTAMQAMMADITAKLADATSQSQMAQTGVASLSPDQKNESVAASNKTALLAARANIKTASTDLQIARKDFDSIAKALRGMNIKASSSTSVKAQ